MNINEILKGVILTIVVSSPLYIVMLSEEATPTTEPPEPKHMQLIQAQDAEITRLRAEVADLRYKLCLMNLGIEP